MRIGDIAIHAATVLPRMTDFFTDTEIIVSATVAADGLSALVETQNRHNLKVGNAVNFAAVGVINPITDISQVGGRVTFTTQLNHDLTFGWTPHRAITLRGFSDAALNGDIPLIDVPNRRQFVINTSAMITANGGEQLIEFDRVDALYGVFGVTAVPAQNTFRVSAAADQPFVVADFLPGSGKIQAKPRIIPTSDARKAFEHYSKQLADKFFMFILPVDITASKDRNTFSDAVAERSTGTDQYQRIVDGFQVLVFAPVSDELSGIAAMDICRHDLTQAITQTFTGVRFDAGTVAGIQPFRTVFLESGTEGEIEAYLAYRYTFQQSFDLTNDDRFKPSTSAFRDIDLEIAHGDNIAAANINLDEELFP